jgi:metallo-beta-lactamase family protein
MKERGLVKSAPNFPVYVDSPLGNAATKIYGGELEGYQDEDTIKVIKAGKKFLEFPNLRVSETSEDSKAINDDKTPKVIISSSGMCDAGRIRHHLKHNLWRPESTVVFVGFQAKGTLGRILVDKAAEKVMLFGEDIAVKCNIYSFRGMSAHADRDGLLKWIHAFEKKPQRVFVVHGETEVCEIFTETLKSEGYDAFAPKLSAVYDLLTDTLVAEGAEAEHKPEDRRAGDRRHGVEAAGHESPVYQRLLTAGTRLLGVIAHNYGGSNKDLGAFADQIIALADKWDR